MDAVFAPAAAAPSVDLAAIAPSLRRGADGLWWPDRQSALDYPDDGNAFCFQVEDTSFWFRHRNRVILDAVRRFPPGGAVFDIGGGNGFVSRGLIQAGVPAVVVEPGATGARNAHARGLSPVVCATLDDAQFTPGTLPAAGLFDVLEHLPDDRGVLRHLASLLCSGGRLYLTVPAFQWLWSDDDVHVGHHRRYTCRSLRAVVASAGFHVEYVSYVFAPLPWPILLLRALPTWLGLRRPADAQTLEKELKPPEGAAVRVLSAVLDLEGRWMRRGGTVPAGSSVLLVATRPGRQDAAGTA